MPRLVEHTEQQYHVPGWVPPPPNPGTVIIFLDDRVEKVSRDV